MNISVNGKTFDYIKGFTGVDHQRALFDNLAGETFGGLSFEGWYRAGLWPDSSVPYMLTNGNTAVAALLVMYLTIRIGGIDKRCAQLSTVMCRKSHRGMGLMRFIMERALEDTRGCDMVFLYGNDSVTSFYPRFGFAAQTEYEYTAPLCGAGSAVPLHINDEEDENFILSMCGQANGFAYAQFPDAHGIASFRCRYGMGDMAMLCKELGVMGIIEHQGDTMICHELLGGGGDLTRALSAFALPQTKRVVLSFKPLDGTGFTAREYHEEDTTLFIHRDHENLFNGQQMRFSELYRA